MSDSVDASIHPSIVDIAQSSSTSKTEKLPGKFEIFISYRTNPDHVLAVALKELIEGMIEPKPSIFVAGAGGLRPSNIGYKPQIQAAVQSSQAFIAIITQQSKEREWIFYEAGAAWGRNQLYVPLLVDTSPSDLASIMADYQAVRVSKQDEVEGLLITVAEAIGGKVKTRFAQRYQAFSKRIEGYQKVELVENNKDELLPLSQALALLQSGELEEANIALDCLEENALTHEERARIRIARLVNKDKRNYDLLRELELLEPELRNTCYCQFWLGLLEPRVTSAITYYQKSLDIAEGNAKGDNEVTFISHLATLNLAFEKFKIGEQEIALETIQQAMIDEDKEFRAKAVEAWQGLEQESHQFEQLVILLTGLDDKPDSLIILNALTKLASDNEWFSLLSYFAQRANEVDSEGSAANNLGNAFQRLKLYSLSYLAYTKAVEAGISVAKANIANLHLSKPLPAAGLTLLQEHTGTYDAADAGYPYYTRAELERNVQNERKKAEELFEQGSKLANMISHFGWEALRSNKLSPKDKQIELESGIATLEESESNHLRFIGNDNRVHLKIKPVGRTIGLWLAVDSDSPVAFYCFTRAGHMLELKVKLSEAAADPFYKQYTILSENEAVR